MKSIEDIIRNIESLYPVDSDYEDIAMIGQQLLSQAQYNCTFDWRQLPERVLREYERLCIKEDNKPIKSKF